MQDSHKVGKLTRFVKVYYRETPVNNLFVDLYDLYSNLSGAVHVNNTENFTPHKYLSDYTKFNQGEIESHLNDLGKVIDSIIQIIYYFSFYLVEEKVEIKKQDLYAFESTLDIYLDLIQSSIEAQV